MEAAVATEARQAARVRLIWVYSVVKDYGSRAGTDLLAAERAELQVTAWVMRRKRRDKDDRVQYMSTMRGAIRLHGPNMLNIHIRAYCRMGAHIRECCISSISVCSF